LKNCHVQGTPNTLLSSSALGSQYAADALLCQLQCMFISRCEAYSFQTTAALIDGLSKVAPSNTSGIFFSDKYPSDGSNFCY
ncbi:hypothetical protein BKA61DRAFT_422618, partial [Leptodontidium sp. MPI-SDFR-AT-0119]